MYGDLELKSIAIQMVPVLPPQHGGAVVDYMTMIVGVDSDGTVWEYKAKKGWQTLPMNKINHD